ncbi:MAG: UDP-N-acetylmuramate dehydrogenase [Clostridiales bacterium]|nr:UDP-N-acetylmuramate dehydrogenase [Clostridiales bacterium]
MRNTLSEFTTFGIGGAAKSIQLARSRSQLIDLAYIGTVLGRGSNILASDSGVDGVIVINRYEHVVRKGTSVYAGSGTRLSALCGALAELGLSGMEWASGIPGTVGGAVRMNAGAFLGEMSDVVTSAEVLRDGHVITLDKPDIGFGYRTSGLKTDDVVIGATIALSTDSPSAIRKRCERYRALRKNSQPVGRSAGSIFKNPPHVSVGKILDEAGLKGLRRGGAVISQKHANIIVNTGGATAKDVCALIAEMRKALLERGVEAQEEIIYLGEF